VAGGFGGTGEKSLLHGVFLEQLLLLLIWSFAILTALDACEQGVDMLDGLGMLHANLVRAVFPLRKLLGI